MEILDTKLGTQLEAQLESIKKSYHGGVKTLPQVSSDVSLKKSQLSDAESSPALSWLEPIIDFESMIESDEPAEAIAEIDRSELYRALSLKNSEELNAILPLISQEQWICIADHDAWINAEGTKDDSGAEVLSIAHFAKWLNAYKNIEPAMMFERFKTLEEEYQIGLLNPHIQLFDIDEYENMPQETQDLMTALPGHELFYHIKTDDPAAHDVIHDLVETGLAVDIQYLISLLAHASQLPPNEQEALGFQFRNSRLEEDGYVSWEEAQELFRVEEFEYIPLAQEASAESSAMVVSHSRSLTQNLLGRVLQSYSSEELWTQQSLKKSLAHLVQTVCTATSVGSDDREGIKTVVDLVFAMVNLGLELKAGTSVDVGKQVLAESNPRDVFKFALGHVEFLRHQVVNTMTAAKISFAPKVHRLFKTLKFGELIYLLDTDAFELFGYELAEFLKGLFNRFPMVPSQPKPGAKIVQFKRLETLKDLSLLKTFVQAFCEQCQFKNKE